MSQWWKWCAVVGASAVAGGVTYCLIRRQRCRRSVAASSSTDSEEEESVAIDKNVYQDAALEQSMHLLFPNQTEELEKKTKGSGRGLKKGKRIKEKHERRINHLNALLDDIYNKFITVKDDRYDIYFGVFCKLFNRIHKKMNEVSHSYKTYSVDNLNNYYGDCRVLRNPNKFHMELPIPIMIENNFVHSSENDIIIEHISPGIVKLRMKNTDNDVTNFNDTPMWFDESGYLLPSKFLHWFKDVVKTALNEFRTERSSTIMDMDEETYKFKLSPNELAITLLLEKKGLGSELFRCDVDLVPVLMFSEIRWPISMEYTRIPDNCNADFWTVVPEIGKTRKIYPDELESWKVSLAKQEKLILNNSLRLQRSYYLIRKLCDSLGINEMSDYHIETLYYNAILVKKELWYQTEGELFKFMVNKLHDTLSEGRIPYFWHKGKNLMVNVSKKKLNNYDTNLQELMEIMDDNNKFIYVAKYILNEKEFNKYNREVLHVPSRRDKYRGKVRDAWDTFDY